MKRLEVIDSRITDQAITLFRLGCAMLEDGVDVDSREWWSVAFDLNRALGFKPWECNLVLELEGYTVPPEKLESEAWRVQRLLHKQLKDHCLGVRH